MGSKIEGLVEITWDEEGVEGSFVLPRTGFLVEVSLPRRRDMVEVLRREENHWVEVSCGSCGSDLRYVPRFKWRTSSGDLHYDKHLLQAYIECPVCDNRISVPDPDDQEDEE